MILPTKHLTPAQSLLGVAALVLDGLDGSRSVNQLWEDLRDRKAVGNFDRFVLALDLLFVMGAVEMADGMVRLTR